MEAKYFFETLVFNGLHDVESKNIKLPTYFMINALSFRIVYKYPQIKDPLWEGGYEFSS
jgi:hypothetical protein